MSNPKPDESLINKFIGTLTGLGGKSGNKKLQQELNLNDIDYKWVRDHLVHDGQLKLGRGRGGSVQLLTGDEVLEARAAIQEREAASVTSSPREESEFKLEEVKSRFRKVPDKIDAFEPGMHVVRPMFSMFNEHNAWKNIRHYTVTKTEEGYVFVRPIPNRKDSVELSSPPVGFYEMVK